MPSTIILENRGMTPSKIRHLMILDQSYITCLILRAYFNVLGSLLAILLLSADVPKIPSIVLYRTCPWKSWFCWFHDDQNDPIKFLLDKKWVSKLNEPQVVKIGWKIDGDIIISVSWGPGYAAGHTTVYLTMYQCICTNLLFYNCSSRFFPGLRP